MRMPFDALVPSSFGTSEPHTSSLPLSAVIDRAMLALRSRPVVSVAPSHDGEAGRAGADHAKPRASSSRLCKRDRCGPGGHCGQAYVVIELSGIRGQQ